jgi:hypothetical protein
MGDIIAKLMTGKQGEKEDGTLCTQTKFVRDHRVQRDPEIARVWLEYCNRVLVYTSTIIVNRDFN